MTDHPNPNPNGAPAMTLPDTHPMTLTLPMARALWSIAGLSLADDLRRAALRVMPDGSARWEATNGHGLIVLDLPETADLPAPGAWIVSAADLERAAMLPKKWRRESDLRVHLSPNTGNRWPDTPSLLSRMTPATSGKPPQGYSSSVLAMPDAVATALGLGKRDGDRIWRWQAMAGNVDGIGSPLNPVRLTLVACDGSGALAGVWMLIMPCRIGW